MKRSSIIMIAVALMVILTLVFGGRVFSTVGTYEGLRCDVPSLPTSTSEQKLLDFEEYCEDRGAIVGIDDNGQGFYWAIVNTLCYHCDGSDIEIWQDDNKCSDDSYYDGQVPLGDIVKYNEREYSFSDLEAQGYCGSDVEIFDCYRCDGSSIDFQEAEDSCPSGWTTNSNIVCQEDEDEDPVVEPSIETVNCYQCNGETVGEREFVDECPTEWSESLPSCTVSTTCYTCDNGEVLSYLESDECAPGYSETLPQDCEPTFFQDIGQYFDFENNPTQAVLLILAIFVIILAIIISVRPKPTENMRVTL